MRIVNLASGSKANCTFVGYNSTKILIDVGLPEKKIVSELAEIGEDINQITAICITHEHSDHIRSLEALAKKYNLDVFVHQDLAKASIVSSMTFKVGQLHQFSDKVFSVGEIDVLPFAVSHDAVAPVGFTLNVTKSKSKVSFVTDTGMVTSLMKQQVAGSKMVFIESNYDREMLWNGRYPRLVKQRIDGIKGHLSNEQSLEFAKYLFENGTKCFILSHLSENNNTPERAYLNYVNCFESQNYVLDKDVFIRLSYQNKHGNNFNLKEEF